MRRSPFSRFARMLGMAVGNPAADAAAPILLRFVAGEEPSPIPMPLSQVQSLGDIFSRELLLKGLRPMTLQDLARDISQIEGPRLPIRKMFLIAEGAQIAAAGTPFELNARLVFTWQAANSTPADLLISTVPVANDPEALLQLIAWSDADSSFHFFERKAGNWVWAGNSFHALRGSTRGKGPFDSHINGGLVMKELKEPWSHWHSMSGSIGRDVFGAESQFNTDPLFAELEGGEALEPVVKVGVRRWTKSRFARDLKNGILHNVAEYLRQVLWCTSFNLVSSRDGFRSNEAEFDLPTSFFFDIDAIEFLAGRSMAWPTLYRPKGFVRRPTFIARRSSLGRSRSRRTRYLPGKSTVTLISLSWCQSALSRI
jgi:hypothetical protein